MPVTTTRFLLKTPQSYGREVGHPFPKIGRVKRVASILALAALVAALTAGAGAQQQTFYTAHAGPTGPVPIITPQPLYYDGYYYPYPFACNNRFSNSSRRGAAQGGHFNNGNHGNPCNGGRPTARPPGPHPTQYPRPRSSG